MLNMKKLLIGLIFAVLFFGMSILTVSAEDGDPDHAAWGVKRTVSASDGNTYTYYVNEDGTFSTEIGDGDIVWLYTESVGNDPAGNSVGTYCWFGISNFRKPDGTRLFKPGSRFSVRFAEPGSEEFVRYWDLMDAAFRRKFDRDRTAFLTFEVTDEDGRSYKVLDDLCELYVQLGGMVTEESIRGYYVGSGMEESLACIMRMLPAGGLPCPEPGRYAVYMINHLDTMVIPKPAGYLSGSVISEPSPVTIALISFVIGAALSAAVTLIVCRKTSRKKA